MVRAHPGLDEAIEEAAASLYRMIDVVMADQRAALAQFPESATRSRWLSPHSSTNLKP